MYKLLITTLFLASLLVNVKLYRHIKYQESILDEVPKIAYEMGCVRFNPGNESVARDSDCRQLAKNFEYWWKN